MKKGKGKLKAWLQSKGKNALGITLDSIGESTNIPFISNIIESIGEGLMSDPNLSEQEKQEAAELIQAELEFYKLEAENTTKRWESDNGQDLKLPRLVRPIVLLYSWVAVTLIIILEACSIVLPSSAIIIGMCGTVNVAYFGSRGYEKIVKYKNKNR